MLANITSQNLYLILQFTFLILGSLLLIFGIKLFTFFLYCTGICSAFLISETLKPFILSNYYISEQQWLLSVLGLGLILGFIFSQTYKLSFYLAITISIYFALNYYATLLKLEDSYIILIVASLLGGLISYFFKKPLVMLTSSALGGIFVGQALPLIYYINIHGYTPLVDAIKHINEIPLSSYLFIEIYNVFNPSLLFTSLPLTLTIIGFFLQYFITGRRKK